MQCHYNAIKFLPNLHTKHPIALMWGRGMGCFLWVQTLIYILSQLLQCCLQYLAILDCIIMASNCIIQRVQVSAVVFCTHDPYVLLFYHVNICSKRHISLPKLSCDEWAIMVDDMTIDFPSRFFIFTFLYTLWKYCSYWQLSNVLLYPPRNEVVGGYTGFCPSVRPASHDCSVAPTVLVGSISYLCILSSNFRMCLV